MSKLSSTNYPNASDKENNFKYQKREHSYVLALFTTHYSFITPMLKIIVKRYLSKDIKDLKVTIAVGITSSHSEQSS